MKHLRILFLTLLASCGGGSSGTGLSATDIGEQRIAFSGIVVDSSNNPVPGAVVTVLASEQQVKTDSDGEFTAISTPPQTTLVVNSNAGSALVTDFNPVEGENFIVISPSNDAKLCKSGSSSCVQGKYCHVPPGACGQTDVLGVCQATPEICTLEYAPVCGCDGKTYSNQCHAAAAGAVVDYYSECENQILM